MPFKTIYNQSNYENSSQGWQVRIHIAWPQIDTRDSTNNRIRDIEQIVVDAFQGDPVEIKLFQIETHEYFEGYNGVLSHKGKDRTEVGKEVCIYLPNSNTQQLSSDDYKNKLLLVWKKLQDAGIQLSYLNIPGDKSITTYAGSPTPFSFTSQNPKRDEWRDRHGILFKEFEPHGEHPILETHFNLGEIYALGIRYGNHEFQPTVQFLTEQKTQVYDDVDRQIEGINANVSPFKNFLFDDIATKTMLKDIVLQIKQQNFNAREATKYLEANPNYQLLAHHYPRAADRDFSQHPALMELTARISTLEDAKIDELVDVLRNDYDNSLNQIKMDFQNNAINLDKIFINTDLDILITKSPANMQTIFRQLALLQQEEKNNTYSNSNQVYEIDELIKYKLTRESISEGQYLGFFGALGRVFGAFSKKEEFDAIDALIISLNDPNIKMDRIHFPPLQHGELGVLLKKMHLDLNLFALDQDKAALNR